MSSKRSKNGSGVLRTHVHEHKGTTNRATSKTDKNRIQCTSVPGTIISGQPTAGRKVHKSCETEEVLLHSEEALHVQSKTCITEEKESQKTTEKEDISDLSGPKLLTSLKIIESLHSLGEPSCEKNVKSKEVDTNKSKKAAPNVNVPFEETVFKGLVDLCVTDEELGLPNFPIHPKEKFRIKDPEPKLSDFYTPKFDTEYVFKPKKPTFDYTDFSMPSPSSVYQRTKRWEPEETY